MVRPVNVSVASAMPTAEPARRWRGAHSTASPTTPPKPVGNGQLAGAGKREAHPAAKVEPDEPEQELAPDPIEALLRDESPSPERGRDQRGDAGEPEELHGDIGDDRAGAAEEIVDRRRRGVIEAGVGD